MHVVKILFGFKQTWRHFQQIQSSFSADSLADHLKAADTPRGRIGGAWTQVILLSESAETTTTVIIYLNSILLTIIQITLIIKLSSNNDITCPGDLFCLQHTRSLLSSPSCKQEGRWWVISGEALEGKVLDSLFSSGPDHKSLNEPEIIGVKVLQVINVLAEFRPKSDKPFGRYRETNDVCKGNHGLKKSSVI